MNEMTSMLAGPTMSSIEDSNHTERQDVSLTKDDPVIGQARPPKLTLYTKVLVIFAAIGGFLFGYDTGVVSGAMILLKKEFNLNTVWVELVVSVTIAAAAVASLFGGVLNDLFGRKPVILLASSIFTAGAVVMAVSQSKEMLLAGRLIVGLGVGFASMTVPMYIAEAAPAHLRGRLVTVNNLFITLGQFVASTIAGALSPWASGWRLMLGLGGVPSAIQLVGFIFLPESPRWLILHGHPERAKKVLRLIYGEGSPEINRELEHISQSMAQQEEERKGQGGQWVVWRILKTPPVLKAVILGCGLQMFQQLSGINTVMYYSATIIQMSGVKDDSTVIWLAAAVAFVNFLFTIVAVYLVDRVGRRVLALGSLSGVAFSLAFLGVGFLLMAIYSPPVTVVEPKAGLCGTRRDCDYCILQEECGFCFETTGGGRAVVNGSCLPVNQSSMDYSGMGRCSAGEGFVDGHDDGLEWSTAYCPTQFGAMALVGLIVYLIFFAPGMGPMPWIINSEIYPQWARSTGNSLSATTNWLFNLLIAMTFLSLTEKITRQGTFFMYAGVSLLGILFIYWLLPETKGRPLEEVITLFSRPWCRCFGRGRSQSHYRPLVGASFREGEEDLTNPLLTDERS